MGTYSGSGSITEIEFIEDIYTHFIEDFVGSCRFSKCKVELNHKVGSDELETTLGVEKDFKTVIINIGENWPRNNDEYCDALIEMIKYIANAEPTFCSDWIDRVRNRDKFC